MAGRLSDWVPRDGKHTSPPHRRVAGRDAEPNYPVSLYAVEKKQQ